ncbi:MAG: metal-dependent hydrolase [Proteobacteria bacterium]|nr:metal-dependent hydrolase [Pseudomonadota bacterium]
MPDLFYAFCDVGHMPVGTALWCGLVAQAFADRRAAFVWLLAGGALHYLLDILQDHDGVGYRLFWPVSPGRFELGWIGSEATVGVALPLLAATLLLWAWVERQRTANDG